MAKKSSIEKNQRRRRLVEKFARRACGAARDRARPGRGRPEERFEATLMLAKLPRNGSRVRVRNRCALTGRARGYHRKFGMSRIALRELGSSGQIPGLVKASW